MNREAIAKIIDPEAWDEISADDNEEGAAIFAEAWEDALSKADAILGLEEGCSSSDIMRQSSKGSATGLGASLDGCEPERCIACTRPFVPGDAWLPDASGGAIHFACCGPERESYTNAEGEPLGPDDPIPTPLVWGDDDSFGEVDCLRYARDLAVSMAETHYPEVPEFRPFDTLSGLLSQIDNMVSGLQRAPVAVAVKS